MSKIQFDIKFRTQIESGEYKVETRDGRTARIICWDRKEYNCYPIIALLEEESGNEILLTYSQNGKNVTGNSNRPSDLFIVMPEPELTPLEDLLSTYLKNDFEYFSTKKWDEKKWNEVMRIQAAELLSLARKQLQPEIDAEIEKAYKNSDSIVYENGILYGKAEALKDMPRWRFSTGCFDDGWINDGVLYYKFHAIPLKTLEELPGFKEDE